MELVLILIRQIAQMFLLCAIGFYLFKRNYISESGLKSIGNILIHLVLPCVIVKGFLVPRDPAHLTGLLVSAILAAATMGISILVSRIAFRKDPIGIFAGTFSNPGFFGIPLIIASLSEGAVFYATSYIAAVNILQFTYGVAVMTGDKGAIKPKAILKAPFFAAIVIGLLLFFLAPPLPALLTGTLNAITALNTPLAMFTIGCYLSTVQIGKMFREKQLYRVSLVRLIIAPLISIPVLLLVPDRFADIRLALMIAACCPVGSNVAVYAQLHGQNYGYAVKTVVISTLLSIISIPLLMYLFQALT